MFFESSPKLAVCLRGIILLGGLGIVAILFAIAWRFEDPAEEVNHAAR